MTSGSYRPIRSNLVAAKRPTSIGSGSMSANTSPTTPGKSHFLPNGYPVPRSSRKAPKVPGTASRSSSIQHSVPYVEVSGERHASLSTQRRVVPRMRRFFSAKCVWTDRSSRHASMSCHPCPFVLEQLAKVSALPKARSFLDQMKESRRRVSHAAIAYTRCLLSFFGIGIGKRPRLRGLPRIQARRECTGFQPQSRLMGFIVIADEETLIRFRTLWAVSSSNLSETISLRNYAEDRMP